MTLVTQICTGYEVVMQVGVEVVMTVVAVWRAVFVATPATTVVPFIQTVWDSITGTTVLISVREVE
jgi:hypothetical protein